MEGKDIGEKFDVNQLIAGTIRADNVVFDDKQYKLVLIPVEPEKKPWPQKHDKYWYLTSYGGIGQEFFTEHDTDYGRFAIGNMYQTEQQAKDAVRALKLIKTINDRRKELNGDWMADWEDGKRIKYCIEIDGLNLIVSGWSNFKYAHKAYPFGAFKDKDNCFQIIQKFKSELSWFFTEYLPEVTG